jgi:hypothetical protein
VSRRRSFTVAREPVELDLGGAELTAPPIIPPAVLGELLDLAPRITEIEQAKDLPQKDQLDQMMKLIDEVMGLVLVPESATVFHDRLFSRTDPFDLQREVMPAIEWLIEEYTDRPTPPSPPSSTGSSDGISSLTSGAPAGESTPQPSLLIDSATPSTPPSLT